MSLPVYIHVHVHRSSEYSVIVLNDHRGTAMIYREDYVQQVLGTTWSPLRVVLSPCSSLEVGPCDEVFSGVVCSAGNEGEVTGCIQHVVGEWYA